ncbi:MAG: 50S ribosomal protein L28 [Anaerolineales bacterium]|nr:50S ribosomal protein L28 [Anaerolineales bacterium]
MSRKCQLSGKKPLSGHRVSHAQNKTKRRWLPNVQDKRIYVPELGRMVKLRVSARALRTLNKKGLTAYLRAEGLSLNDII